MSSLLRSIQLDQMNLFIRLEELEAMSHNDTTKPASELKVKDYAKEALENEKARALE